MTEVKTGCMGFCYTSILIPVELFCVRHPLPGLQAPRCGHLSPSHLPPSCSSSSSLPCVCACFRAWQEAQIRGLKLDQIFSRYRFLTVPGFRTSSTQLLFHPSPSPRPTAPPPLNSPSLLLPLAAVTNKVVCRTQIIHTHTHSHRQRRTYAHGES